MTALPPIYDAIASIHEPVAQFIHKDGLRNQIVLYFFVFVRYKFNPTKKDGDLLPSLIFKLCSF